MMARITKEEVRNPERKTSLGGCSRSHDLAGSPFGCPGLAKSSTTPEVDKLWIETETMESGDAECALRKLAERLERERNEARSLASGYRENQKKVYCAMGGKWDDEAHLFPWENIQM